MGESGSREERGVSDGLAKTMRASSLVLGPLAARAGPARVSLPGVAPSGRGLSSCGARWPAWRDGEVTGCVPEHVNALTAKLQQAGVSMTQPDATSLHVNANGGLHAVDVTTEEYPGFATDLLAQYMALMTQAEGFR